MRGSGLMERYNLIIILSETKKKKKIIGGDTKLQEIRHFNHRLINITQVTKIN